MTDRCDWTSSPAGPLCGEVAVPGDKSVSHRAIMLAALADGVSRIEGFLEGADTRATAAIFQAMGVSIESPSAARRIVRGVGLHGLSAPRAALDCGNSGTAMRLVAGLLAGQPFDSILSGDASLSRRPMRRIIEPLAAMGARIDSAPHGLPPLSIQGRAALRGIVHQPSVASAQVKSAVLLGGLYARGETEIREFRPTRDHTERLLAAFDWPIRYEPGRARLAGGHRLRAADVVVPADFSSAAFFLVAASLVPGSELLLRGVGMNPRRTGLLGVLRAMGADITVENARESPGEPVADLRALHAPLNGIEVPVDAVADMIDEFPALFIAAAGARGDTVIRGAAELRVKESDRIAVMASGLRELGIAVDEAPDGAVVHGGRLRGGSVDSAGDHRCAMAFAVAGLVADAPVRIADCANVATSFPGFTALAARCGFCLDPLPDSSPA
jgi:3-phosphoshikimate 1-carboxyvinyltransferase